jgi:hypothetical protein
MRNRRHQGRGQLVLELQRRDQPALATASATGLVEALADLLLAALGRGVGTTTTVTGGGGDERQDHG